MGFKIICVQLIVLCVLIGMAGAQLQHDRYNQSSGSLATVKAYGREQETNDYYAHAHVSRCHSAPLGKTWHSCCTAKQD
jgi:hypothetical protein